MFEINDHSGLGLEPRDCLVTAFGVKADKGHQNQMQVLTPSLSSPHIAKSFSPSFKPSTLSKNSIVFEGESRTFMVSGASTI